MLRLRHRQEHRARSGGMAPGLAGLAQRTTRSALRCATTNATPTLPT